MGRLSTGHGLSAGEDDPDFVRALARGLSVLECFDAQHGAMTLAEIADRIGLTRGSTRRLLLTLQHLGFVGTDGTQFFPRSRVLKLGFGYLSGLPVWNAARTYLAEIARQTNESCSVAVLDGSDIVYVARQPAKRLINDYIPIGTRFPAHSTSMGKVLLAGLSDAQLATMLSADELPRMTPNTITSPAEVRREILRTRERGWAINDEEIEIGLRSIAVPIRDRTAVTCASVNISAPAARVPVEQLIDWLPALQRAADAIGLLMTHR